MQVSRTLLFYSYCVAPFVRTVAAVLSVANPKLRERISSFPGALASIPPRTQGVQRVLFHAASMGEVEQCIPVIERLKTLRPHAECVVSCSSPSGYHHAKCIPAIDAAVYAPLEGIRETKQFFSLLHPDIVVINRYDVWPAFVASAARKAIPILLMNGTMPSAARGLGKLLTRASYACISHIVAATPNDATELGRLVSRPIATEPDTRIDRVLDRVSMPREDFSHLQQPNIITIVVGSSWQSDEELVFTALQKVNNPSAFRLIVVPHEPTEETLERIESKLRVVRLSQATSDTQGHILVDRIGVLVELYQLGQAAFVGGGFGVGVHSLTEPAAFNLPLACGPNISRSRDATALVESGVCTVVRTRDDVVSWMRNTVADTTSRNQTVQAARNYVTSRSGSASVYAGWIHRVLSEQPQHS